MQSSCFKIAGSDTALALFMSWKQQKMDRVSHALPCIAMKEQTAEHCNKAPSPKTRAVTLKRSWKVNEMQGRKQQQFI